MTSPRIEKCLISNLDVGITTSDNSRSAAIRIANGASIDVRDVNFENVTTPFDVPGLHLGCVAGTRIHDDPKLNADLAFARSSSGWRRPKGPPLTIFCPSCKSISISKNYVFGGDFFRFRNNEEACPVCKVYGARLSEGLFRLIEDTVKILEAPDMTYTMLAAIERISYQAFSGEIAPEQAAYEVAGISQPLSQIMKNAGTFGKTVVGLVAAVATILTVVIMKQQTDIAREQNAIAREQIEIQKLDGLSTQRLLEEFFESFARSRTGQEPVDRKEPIDRQEPPRDPDQHDAEPPSEQEAPGEATTTKFLPCGANDQADVHVARPRPALNER